jgi:hypothetical protein
MQKQNSIGIGGVLLRNVLFHHRFTDIKINNIQSVNQWRIILTFYFRLLYFKKK